MSNKPVIFTALMSAFLLAGCGEDGPDPAFLDEDTEILADYNLGISNGKIIEFRSVSNPELIMIAVDGNDATGLAVLGPDTGYQGEPSLLARYEVPRHVVYEFTPASSPETICIFADGHSSGALTCDHRHPTNPGQYQPE